MVGFEKRSHLETDLGLACTMSFTKALTDSGVSAPCLNKEQARLHQ